MSAHPNVAAVNRMTKAIFEQDREELSRLFTDDMRFHLRGPFERAGDPERIAEALGTRDEQDARTNPFVPAPDAVVLDTTELTPDEVAHRALALARERGLAP